MKVPLLDLQAQYAAIKDDIREAVDRVLESQHFILGPEVEALEEEIAAFCGVKYAIGVSSGTDALLVALMALDIGPGDEVITTAYSFFATAGVIVRLGAKPVFVDIDPKTFNINSEMAADKVTARTKAFLPVHLYGRCADLGPMLEVSEAKGIPIVEDAAQAIGSFDSEKRQAGTMGRAGCFSFFPSKNLGAFGDGGMVVTNDEAFATKIRVLRVHGSEPKYFHKVVGGNFRLDALQAAVLRVKLKHLPAWTEARRENAKRYVSFLSSAGSENRIQCPQDEPGHIYNQFVISTDRRDGLQDFLREKKIASEVYYPLPLSLQECFSDLGHDKGAFANSEKASLDSLALPIYPELGEDRQRHIVKSIEKFLAK